MKYISRSLHGAVYLAKTLNNKNVSLTGESELNVCWPLKTVFSFYTGSDTDHSCLMASLVQIFLRPICRTIKGFCELIVREWIVRGHRFLERFGHVSNSQNNSQEQKVR